MIVVTVFLSILNQMEIHLVQNRKENCHQSDSFTLVTVTSGDSYVSPFNVKGKVNIVFSVYGLSFSTLNSM